MLWISSCKPQQSSQSHRIWKGQAIFLAYSKGRQAFIQELNCKLLSEHQTFAWIPSLIHMVKIGKCICFMYLQDAYLQILPLLLFLLLPQSGTRMLIPGLTIWFNLKSQIFIQVIILRRVSFINFSRLILTGWVHIIVCAPSSEVSWQLMKKKARFNPEFAYLCTHSEPGSAACATSSGIPCGVAADLGAPSNKPGCWFF